MSYNMLYIRKYIMSYIHIYIHLIYEYYAYIYMYLYCSHFHICICIYIHVFISIFNIYCVLKIWIDTVLRALQTIIPKTNHKLWHRPWHQLWEAGIAFLVFSERINNTLCLKLTFLLAIISPRLDELSPVIKRSTILLALSYLFVYVVNNI